jgi:hypothetical protein
MESYNGFSPGRKQAGKQRAAGGAKIDWCFQGFPLPLNQR